MKNNITLIGMPGSGKSTVGVVLAKRLGRRFVDSDLVIQERHGKLLHELITEHGVEGFWQIESNVNASLNLENSIIATGGSACYEPEGMQHLRDISRLEVLVFTSPLSNICAAPGSVSTASRICCRHS